MFEDFSRLGYGGAQRLAPEVQVANKYINGNNKSVKKFNEYNFDFEQFSRRIFRFSYENTANPAACHTYEICIVSYMKQLLNVTNRHCRLEHFMPFNKEGLSSCRAAW